MTETRPQLDIKIIDGGFRVRTSADGRHHLDVLKMAYNWRLVTTPVDHEEGYDRGWRYFGHGDGRTMGHAFRAAFAAAMIWDGSDDTEPPGYDKRVGG